MSSSGWEWTTQGLTTLFFGALLLALGVLGGNNPVLGIGSLLLAALVVDLLVGAHNLRGVVVERLLPEEFFAGRPAPGAFRVSGALVHALEIGDGVASASLPEVRNHAEVRVWWRLPKRGWTVLSNIEVRSRYPFGGFLHRRTLAAHDAVLVYPRPVEQPGAGRALMHDAGLAHGRLEGGGDLVDLRPYRVGDRLNALHWPTSARTGRPMVGVRTDEVQAALLAQLQDHAPLESELERCTHLVLIACERGLPVGLLGADRELERPRRGVRWRRRLLEALAVHGRSG